MYIYIYLPEIKDIYLIHYCIKTKLLKIATNIYTEFDSMI